MNKEKKVKTENSDQTVEKSKSTKKSSYSKKKKIKKNILNGIAYVQSTFNNTIVSIADTDGNVISWASAGQKGFKGSRKSTPYAAQVAADSAASKALEYGIYCFNVESEAELDRIESVAASIKMCSSSSSLYSFSINSVVVLRQS